MISNVISAIIGLALFVAFLGIIVVWVKPIPFAIIVLGVIAMVVYDLFLSLSSDSGGPH